MCWAEKKQPKITSQSLILGSRLKPDMPALFLCPFKIDFWLPLASRVLFSLCPSPHMWSHQPHHKPSPSTFALSWRNTCQHTNGFSKHSFPLEQSASTGLGENENRSCILLGDCEGGAQIPKCCRHFASFPEPLTFADPNATGPAWLPARLALQSRVLGSWLGVHCIIISEHDFETRNVIYYLLF